MKKVVINRTKNEKDGETFLMHAVNELQADTVESLLRSYEIPVMKKRRGTGGYLNIITGINIYGVDLYVPAKLHRAAMALVKTRNPQEDETDDEIEQEDDLFRKKRLNRIWIIIGIFYLPVLAWILIKAFQ
ncbi:MAG: hypothetical protein KBA53_11240 [Thermoclostridium sp.]|nr:hypothetical protein [Thermoclostridium sp.]